MMAAITERGLRPAIEAIGTATPEPAFTTTELVEACGDRVSDELAGSLSSMGVERRHTVIENYAELVRGGGSEPRITTSATSLALAALRNALRRGGAVDPGELGLLVAVSNTQAAIMPGLAPAMLGEDGGLLPRDLPLVNMQGQGCAALLKGAEVASWFLAAHPEKTVAVIASEAQTPYVAVPVRGRCRSLGEIRRGPRDAAAERDVRRTIELTQALLFGDGAVALLLRADADGARLGPFAHLTNEREEDAALLSMLEGGTARPNLRGRPRYRMASGVPARGAAYAATTAARAIAAIGGPGRAEAFFIHTGSRKILNGVCDRLGVDPGSDAVRHSYDVLRRFGNLSSASVGFMLARSRPETLERAVVSAFGVGFSATAAAMTGAPVGRETAPAGSELAAA